ncbi:DUF3043 domain-containing protein [Dactylosporangium aurantiacum]|uniref:DUF3043 domain-containing protein n=1 Tax=Dactylosporangium aurantiacum TaxID=35754 RepID=A0A9Q9IBC3_9ACTN|nr:DUF3043 domain-containing protein [Dactylosporangium aurantiacum]MDG6102400.1 DUF3043 domain-containing protein [Dactylosporangium aurantiacum]UWZ53309.1 DUF3043 domain-containing protein [Dactylosporangium aurantiacum]
MPSLFSRKSAEPAEAPAEEPAQPEVSSGKRQTLSKRELGKTTPKRVVAGRRVVEPPATNRREAAKRMRERQRAERLEAREGMANGDERFLLPRDKGPERRLVRDIVDSRRTIGTFFFGTTFLVMLVGFNRNLNPSIYFAANALFGVMAVATAIDSFLISRTIKRLIKQRFPSTNERLGRLYFYAIMRAISFRFIRNPKPQVKIGASV